MDLRNDFVSALFVLLCITCCSCLDSKGLTSDLRDFVGLGTDVPQTSRRAVIVFSGNRSSEGAVPTGGTIDEEDLIGLAMDMEDHDPNSLYVHYNGNDLVTSQPALFNEVENVEGTDSWPTVLVRGALSTMLEVTIEKLEDDVILMSDICNIAFEASYGFSMGSYWQDKVKLHRAGEESPLADLLVFESHPEELRDEVAKLCDTLYSPGKCQIVQGQIRSSQEDVHARYRRQAEPTSTTTQAPPVRASNILPVMPYPAAFQLLFWVTLAIFLTVYGVAWGMWNMDPGRDSIIYRMTSAQKYKKDK